MTFRKSPPRSARFSFHATECGGLLLDPAQYALTSPSIEQDWERALGLRRLLERGMRKYLRVRGYAISRYPSKQNSEDYYIYDYAGPDGAFSYEEYVQTQIAGNKRKINNVWADEKTIDFIASYIRTTNPNAERGLCHGTRNGAEVRWFREKLNIDITGTDISDTATQFPNTVQWDFHERNPTWANAFDFVYTNSHDHAYDPKKAFTTWVEQLKTNGRLFIEHTMEHSEEATNQLDPFGVNPKNFPYVILSWSQGRFAVTRLLEPPHTKPNGGRIWIFVIEPTERAVTLN